MWSWQSCLVCVGNLNTRKTAGMQWAVSPFGSSDITGYTEQCQLLTDCVLPDIRRHCMGMYSSLVCWGLGPCVTVWDMMWSSVFIFFLISWFAPCVSHCRVLLVFEGLVPFRLLKNLSLKIKAWCVPFKFLFRFLCLSFVFIHFSVIFVIIICGSWFQPIVFRP